MAVTTKATPVVFTTSTAATAAGYGAEVASEQVGPNLVMTLSNTSTDDLLNPQFVLTAVFFTLAGNQELQPISAIVSPGSGVLFGYPTDPDGVVGGEWAYRNGLTDAPFGANSGISSARLDIFTLQYRFPGTDLQAPLNLDGIQYGLTSAGDDPATGASPVIGAKALIKNSVVFTLRLPENYAFTEDSISSVGFKYGVEMSTRNRRGVKKIPEPTTAVLTVAGLLAVCALCRGRRRH
jgi:hypothetical protein